MSRSRLSTTPGTATFDAAALAQAADVRHVAAAAGTLALENTTFSGELPDLSQGPPQPGQGATGGADGAGGSAFDVDRFSVLGIDPTSAAVGPLTTVSVVEGRALTADDAAANVALLDSAYASGAEPCRGRNPRMGDGTVEIVGIVESSTGATGHRPAPTSTCRSPPPRRCPDLTAQVSDVYVQADSAENIPSVATALEAALPDATVSTQEDLASAR